jgi:hypothetical protein
VVVGFAGCASLGLRVITIVGFVILSTGATGVVRAVAGCGDVIPTLAFEAA